MKMLLSFIALSVAFLSVAAQTPGGLKQSSIKVDGSTYTVTEYPSRPSRPQMVMLSGPQGNAMVQIEGGKITAYISPPGGGGQQPLINKVWNAYLASKGGAEPTHEPTSTAPSSGGLTVDGVMAMLKVGVSSDVIVTKIQQSGKTFDLSTDEIVNLKSAGASDAVMKAMMSPASQSQAPASVTMADRGNSIAPPVNIPPNALAENPNMGKLKKEGFLGTLGHSVTNAMNGRSVIDQLSMRNILPQWDPNQKVSAQYPHIAITVLYAPMGWMDDYREALKKNNKLAPPCFKLKATVWLDATRSKQTDEFQWCIEHDMFMSQLQPTYLFSLAASNADRGQTSGVNRTDGPQPPDKLLPNDRATLDMEAKTNVQGASKDLNLDSNSMFALMFANVRKDLGETLGSDGDYRVWITSIKKAAGASLF